MKQDFERIKSDMQTIQKAMGLSSASQVGREWVAQMKRDNWINLGWCVPGLMLIVSALLPIDAAARWLGLVPAQWTGLLVASAMLVMTVLHLRQLRSGGVRPEGLVQEYKRLNGVSNQGFQFHVVLVASLAVFYLWSRQFQLGFHAVWSGLWLFLGATCLFAALAAKIRLLLGWALPFLAYGLFETVMPSTGRASSVALGLMFIGVALSFSLIQVLEIRKIECQNEAH